MCKSARQEYKKNVKLKDFLKMLRKTRLSFIYKERKTLLEKKEIVQILKTENFKRRQDEDLASLF